MSKIMNSRNHPGGRIRLNTTKSKEQDEQRIKAGITPPSRVNFLEQRRASIALLRAEERIQEEIRQDRQQEQNEDKDNTQTVSNTVVAQE